MGEAIELIGYLCQGTAGEVVIFFTVEVYAHEVHLYSVAYVLFFGFLSVEEARRVVLVNSPR